MAALLVAACGDDGGGGGGTSLKGTIGLDLSHITGFALSGGASPGGASPRIKDGANADAIQQLYAIDDQGNLIVTTLTTSPDGDAGSTNATEVPLSISDTTNYTVFEFSELRISSTDANGDLAPQRICSAVFMRKSDGSLFCYEGGDFANVKSNGSELLFVDGAAMIGGNGGLQRIDMASDPPQVAAVSDEATAAFDVSLDGDVLVSLDATNGSTSNGVRIYKQGGGLQNLVASRSSGQWLEPGGHAFYYFYVDPSMSTTFNVAKATRQANGSYATAAEGTVSVYNLVDPQPTTGGGVLLTGSDVAYLWRNSSVPTIADLIGPQQNTDHQLAGLTGFATITDVRAALGVLFVQGTDSAGNGGIARIDVPAFAATTILPPGDFSLTAISPSKTGELSFAGLRNSDGKRVVGRVPAGSNTYEVTSETAPTVTYLQRIN